MLFIITQIAYFIVIALHLYFAVLEMALWKTKGPKIFGITPEFASDSAGLASNQGLYNLFLVAALLIGFFTPDPNISDMFVLYGLGCVMVAGVWGAITVNIRILFVQALPALFAFGLYLLIRLPSEVAG